MVALIHIEYVEEIWDIVFYINTLAIQVCRLFFHVLAHQAPYEGKQNIVL